MDIIEYRDFCLRLKGVEEALPFDEKTLVFKVLGKMFALTDIDEFKSINLKCDPEKAIELREEYQEVKPGYHMNKKHWNTVSVEGHLKDDLIRAWTMDSYYLVISKMTKKMQKSLLELE